MKNNFVFIFSILLILISFNSYSSQYLVKLNNGYSLQSIKSLALKFQLEPVKTFKQINVYSFKSVRPLSNKEVESINSHPNIKYFEPNYKVTMDLGTPKPHDESSYLWGMKNINAQGAWQITRGSKKVILAVSDTGIWMPHEDLNNNIWINDGESGKDSNGNDRADNGIDDDGNGFIDDVHGWDFQFDKPGKTDAHYHGTHVAGTIGGVGGNNDGIVGVNWNTSLMILKFLGSNGSGTTENAIETILYAADNGAKAVNCSWGGGSYNNALFDAIEYAKQKGMLVVASAGNSGRLTDDIKHYPSSYPNDNLISIASNSPDDKLSSFSNYGVKTVDLAAPGYYIYSTINPMHSTYRGNWFTELSGTSMSSPHVTGAIGLIYSVNPKLKWYQVKEILLSTVKKVEYLKDKVLSGGKLDVANAVIKAKGM